MVKVIRNHNDFVLRYVVGSGVLLVSLALMGAFACLVIANQESAQAVTQILTAIGVVGLMASICMNYAPTLDKEGEKRLYGAGSNFYWRAYA